MSAQPQKPGNSFESRIEEINDDSSDQSSTVSREKQDRLYYIDDEINSITYEPPPTVEDTAYTVEETESKMIPEVAIKTLRKTRHRRLHPLVIVGPVAISIYICQMVSFLVISAWTILSTDPFLSIFIRDLIFQTTLYIPPIVFFFFVPLTAFVLCVALGYIEYAYLSELIATIQGLFLFVWVIYMFSVERYLVGTGAIFTGIFVLINFILQRDFNYRPVLGVASRILVGNPLLLLLSIGVSFLQILNLMGLTVAIRYLVIKIFAEGTAQSLGLIFSILSAINICLGIIVFQFLRRSIAHIAVGVTLEHFQNVQYTKGFMVRLKHFLISRLPSIFFSSVLWTPTIPFRLYSDILKHRPLFRKIMPFLYISSGILYTDTPIASTIIHSLSFHKAGKSQYSLYKRMNFTTLFGRSFILPIRTLYISMACLTIIVLTKKILPIEVLTSEASQFAYYAFIVLSTIVIAITMFDSLIAISRVLFTCFIENPRTLARKEPRLSAMFVEIAKKHQEQL